MNDGIRHAFVSEVADALDPDEVGPDEWNDQHDPDERGVIDDVVLATWIDRADEITDQGQEFLASSVVVGSAGGPNGENYLETSINGSVDVLYFHATPGDLIRFEFYGRPKQGGGAIIRVNTGGVNFDISTDTADVWKKYVRIIRTGSDGLLTLRVVWQHWFANIIVKKLGTRHLYDSWIDRADTDTENGLATTNLTRNAGGAPDGRAKLSTPSGAGPSTHVTWSNLPPLSIWELEVNRDPVAGGSTFLQVTTQQGTLNVGKDVPAGTWTRERLRFTVGEDGSLVLKSTFTNDFADLRLWFLGEAPIIGGPLIVPAPYTDLLESNNSAFNANEAFAVPFTIPGRMLLQGLVIRIQATGSGTHEWGLFRYDKDPTAAEKVAGGSSAIGSTGFVTIAATGAPVIVEPGNYILILKAPGTNMATYIYATSNSAPGVSTSQASYTWDDTPNLTTGWTTTAGIITMYLIGRLVFGEQWP